MPHDYKVAFVIWRLWHWASLEMLDQGQAKLVHPFLWASLTSQSQHKFSHSMPLNLPAQPQRWQQ